MQSSTTESKFFQKNNTDIICLSLSALAIVVFLSVAFVWFDATSLPPSNSAIGETHQPAVKHPDVDLSAPSEDLVAAAKSPLLSAPFEFVSNAQGSLAYKNLKAMFTFDNKMWRYTTDGWQDISRMNNQPQTPKPFLENVHPVIWAAILFLSSLLLLIMACSEQDVIRLFSRSQENQ